ncbi:phosphoribosyl-dephospho-CoA transferase [Rhodoferax sp. OV413]|uniref:malonate decarboxylase holo-[acyl-carrier-protein] synthase n=1 Tax=Rhodoferax sp. OV413 TaxID=1855285 RepID=UPI00087EAC8D|nr:malonate decarboxylase holo-[acyl-carrier-protein] synthase [Rhodoferax sp. OV413]SDP83271.1 phosphoribosyl-dephospho-CoA transferase [Rhodoferax sp. OV413]
MRALQRNQLVWLHEAAWAGLAARQWMEAERTTLAHWQQHRLPLVVCRQAPCTPTQRISVGLAAPRTWAANKLALDLAPEDIQAHGDFPTLQQIAHGTAWQHAAQALADALGVTAHVYGSYGWQHLSGLGYVHAESDIDLSLQVPDMDSAQTMATQLESAQLPMRIDGELVFAGGHAVAWREYARLLQGRTRSVMVKSRHSLQLADLPALQALTEATCTN